MAKEERLAFDFVFIDVIIIVNDMIHKVFYESKVGREGCLVTKQS